MPTNAKMTFKIGAGEWGWGEEWYWTMEADDQPIERVIRDARNYARLRKAFLSVHWSIQGCEIEMTDAFGASFLVGNSLTAYEQIGGGPGTMAGACADPWLCLLQQWYTAGSLYHRSLLIRGMPSGKLCIDEDYSIPYTLDPSVKAAMQPWIDYIFAAPDPNNPLAKYGRFCLRVVNKDRSRRQKVHIQAAEITPAGWWKITTTAPIVTYDVDPITGLVEARNATQGDTLHAHVGQNPTLNGLTGDHPIIAATDTPDFSYTIAARQCVACTPQLRGREIAWGVNYTLEPVTSQDVSRVTNRPTGGPFFGTHGRQPACRR